MEVEPKSFQGLTRTCDKSLELQQEEDLLLKNGQNNSNPEKV
jgi:hypothetical protein